MWGRVSPKNFGIEGCYEVLEKEKIALHRYIDKVKTATIPELQRMADIGIAVKRLEDLEKRVKSLGFE